MERIVHIALFSICSGVSALFYTFFLFNVIVPLFWLPYVLFKIIGGKYRISAIFPCITAPIIWMLSCILVLYFASYSNYLWKIISFVLFSKPAIIGMVLGICNIIKSAFSEEAKKEFLYVLSHFKITKVNSCIYNNNKDITIHKRISVDNSNRKYQNTDINKILIIIIVLQVAFIYVTYDNTKKINDINNLHYDIEELESEVDELNNKVLNLIIDSNNYEIESKIKNMQQNIDSIESDVKYMNTRINIMELKNI